MTKTVKRHPEYVRLEARRLYQDGLTRVEIASRLSVALTTVYRWVDPVYAERIRRQSREAKRRRTGTCEDCGAETRYNGHAENGASHLCLPCSNKRTAAARKIWTRDRIIEAIQWWADQYGTQPAIADFNPSGAVRLGDYQRAVRAERHIAAREIPTFITVIREFGSWNAGIADAGFAPLANHGGNGNGARRRKRYA